MNEPKKWLKIVDTADTEWAKECERESKNENKNAAVKMCNVICNFIWTRRICWNGEWAKRKSKKKKRIEWAV